MPRKVLVAVGIVLAMLLTAGVGVLVQKLNCTIIIRSSISVGNAQSRGG